MYCISEHGQFVTLVYCITSYRKHLPVPWWILGLYFIVSDWQCTDTINRCRITSESTRHGCYMCVSISDQCSTPCGLSRESLAETHDGCQTLNSSPVEWSKHLYLMCLSEIRVRPCMWMLCDVSIFYSKCRTTKNNEVTVSMVMRDILTPCCVCNKRKSLL